MTNKTPKWKKYQSKTYKTLKRLKPKSEVEHDVYQKGRLSKSKRQIDVAVDRKIKNDFIVYECKDQKRPIDTPEIEKLNTKLKDVQSKNGAVVSNSRFTSGAKNMARALGINLYNLIDAKDKNIVPQPYAKVFLEDTYLKSYGLTFSSNDSNAKLATVTKPTEIYFKNPKGGFYSTYDIIRMLWNKGKDLTYKPGSYMYHPIRIIGDVGLWIKKQEIVAKKIAFRYVVDKRNHIAKVKIVEARGLYNVEEGTFQAFGSVASAPIIPYQIQKQTEPTKLTLKEALKQKKVTFALSMNSVMPKKPNN